MTSRSTTTVATTIIIVNVNKAVAPLSRHTTIILPPTASSSEPRGNGGNGSVKPATAANQGMPVISETFAARMGGEGGFEKATKKQQALAMRMWLSGRKWSQKREGDLERLTHPPFPRTSGGNKSLIKIRSRRTQPFANQPTKSANRSHRALRACLETAGGPISSRWGGSPLITFLVAKHNQPR